MNDATTAPGCLITVEGIDGAGKSTQVDLLAALLLAQGHHLVSTREPGGTVLGRELRRMVLGRELALTAEAELLLFLADRVEHLATVITPALRPGRSCSAIASQTRPSRIKAMGGRAISPGCGAGTPRVAAGSWPT